MHRRRGNIEALPGIAPWVEVGSSLYSHEREIPGSDIVPDRIVHANETAAQILSPAEDEDVVCVKGVANFLTELPYNKNNPAYVGELSETHFTNFLARTMGIRPPTVRRVAGKAGFSITIRPIGDSEQQVVSMAYGLTKGRLWPTRCSPLAIALISEHDDYVNMMGFRPFEGRGNVAGVPGAIEALVADARFTMDEFLYTRNGLHK